MAIKKSELYSSLWKSCDELRGGMDASQYKDYVLVLLFVKYVSDKAKSQKHYDLVVPKGGSFDDIVALKGAKDIGDKMNKVIAKLATPNELTGVITVADWCDVDKLGKDKEMVDRLSNLVGLFQGLDFGGNRADGDDLLGDAYEYLMRHFATESGKSKGQFYTPAEVSRIIAKVIGLGGVKDSKQTIHDPTCGSGSLLLKAHDEAQLATGCDLALYGQEMDNATSALARMNLILHDCPTGLVEKNNTLASPQFLEPKTGRLKTFDFVVANPPFSTKAWSNGVNVNEDPFGRFAFGVPPEKNGDYAFLLHILTCLRSNGKGAVILPHGVLFRGGAEAAIRKEIVTRGYIKGIIGLPANLFFGTGIPACIIVLDKEGAAARKGLFMIDASKGFIKDGNKNRLRAQDIHKIVDTFNNLVQRPRYSRMVPLAEISDPKNDFNLNLPRYIDSSEPEDLQDIDAHLRGGIPNRDLDDLQRYWDVFPSIRTALFKKANRAGYSQLRVPVTDIKSTIFEHEEFTAWSDETKKRFTKWRKKAATQLRAVTTKDKPKLLIESLSEELLNLFEKAHLLDAYDVYQHLQDYCAVTLQDDLYLIVSDGWKKAAQPRQLLPTKDKNGKVSWPEQHDFVISKDRFKADLIPPTLLIAKYFAADQNAIEALEAEAASATQTMEELAEENSGEDGVFEELKTEKGKIQKAAVAARLKEIQKDRSAADERKVLSEYLSLIEKEAALSAKAKSAQEALLGKVVAKYGKLTEEDIKSLVVDDKWMTTIEASVQGELDRVSQTLSGRLRELAERYASPLPELTSEVEALSARVEAHLKKMGVQW